MSTVIRRIAISGSAAVALLGGVATVAAAASETTSAGEIQHRIDRATGAPVTLPDGRVMHIRGLDTAGQSATPEQHTATAVLAAYKADADDPAGITNGLTPDSGSGSALQNPLNSGTGAVQTGVNDQIVTQASGGTVAVGIVAIFVLGIIVFVRVKHRDIKPGDAVLVGLFGIAISGTVIGAMGNQMTTSLVGSLSGVLGGL
ncbi:hypothetical protein ABZ725_14340 [Streptomyces sp. NPDC006872]|uniref:hypothetical protein n=1 Tax=Streptomyces sp. NPDC006872 TaxID=3155720 RepID=UPI0033C04B6A